MRRCKMKDIANLPSACIAHWLTKREGAPGETIQVQQDDLLVSARRHMVCVGCQVLVLVVAKKCRRMSILMKPPKAGDQTKTPRTKKANRKRLSPGWMVVVGASLLFPLAPIRNHGEGQEGERVRNPRLHHPPQQAVVWRDLQEACAAGCEGGEEVCPADDEDQVCVCLFLDNIWPAREQ